jgi:hypothetical protein
LKRWIGYLIIGIVCSGCAASGSNQGLMAKYAVPESEAEWIRNGEPIEFQGRRWHPQTRYDVLLDSEVLFQGEHRGVAFFTEKIDIRPYGRLLTKFGRNKFRVYEPEE